MILGMSLATFVLVHVVISLIGIVAGIIVMFGMLGSKRMPGLTAIFLAFTILTSASGFLFPPLLFEKLQKGGVPVRMITGPWDHLQGSSGEDVGKAGYGSLQELWLRWSASTDEGPAAGIEYEVRVNGVINEVVPVGTQTITYTVPASVTSACVAAFLA